MNTSKQIQTLVYELVNGYSKYSRTDGCYLLDARELPEHELNRLAGLIVSQDDDYASESTGFDNDEFAKSMRPALAKAMMTLRTPDAMADFYDSWISGVRTYLMDYMERLIEDQLEDYNGEQGCAVELCWNPVTETAYERKSL